MKATHPALALSLLVALPATQAADPLEAFPPAEAGMVRHVLRLPKQHDESAFKVEPIIRKTIQTEERNRYFFGGRIEDRAPSDFPEPRTSPVGRAAGVSAYRQSP